MLNWLRQRVRFLERRWMHDPRERTEHTELVRERLAAAPDTREDPPDAGDEPDVRNPHAMQA